MPRTRPFDDAGPDGPAWSDPSLREPRYSQSLERGLAILGCFSAERPALGIAEIADELGMSRSTTHRYAITLVALGYLEQGAHRKYRLGLRVTDLGMAALSATGLREHAHAHLDELRRRTTYAAGIAVLEGEEVLYVDRAPSFRRGRATEEPSVGPGSRLPCHCTALGKLLLAHLPEDEQRERVEGLALARLGPNTITSKRALREELLAIRERGLAVSDRELTPGLCAIAAPVRDQGSEVLAAVDLAAPTSAISAGGLREALAPHLLATADRISARLGYRRDDERA